MGSRLIFLHRRMMRWGDGSRKVVRRLEESVSDSKKVLRQIRAHNSRDWDERTCSRSNRKWFQEKPLSFSHTRPYRKPTQVGEMSILRRLRELGRRNSANWYRNFGKRYAPVAWSLYCDRAK